MAKKKIVNYKLIIKSGLMILAMCIVLGLFLVAYSAPQVKESIALATTKKPETFTELYFEDHLKLPDKIEVGKEESFKFTIHNQQYLNTDYKYEIKAFVDSGEYILASGSAMLSSGEYKTINENITMATSSRRIKFQVLLINQKQSIHFWVENI